MAKLILLSVLIALVTLPILASKEANAVRGLKKAMFWMFLFNLGYLFAVQYVYPHVVKGF